MWTSKADIRPRLHLSFPNLNSCLRPYNTIFPKQYNEKIFGSLPTRPWPWLTCPRLLRAFFSLAVCQGRHLKYVKQSIGPKFLSIKGKEILNFLNLLLKRMLILRLKGKTLISSSSKLVQTHHLGLLCERTEKSFGEIRAQSFACLTATTTVTSLFRWERTKFASLWGFCSVFSEFEYFTPLFLIQRS